MRVALGQGGCNDLQARRIDKRIDCVTFPPPDAGRLAQERIECFLETEVGWLVLALHGADGEGWGTLSSDALACMLDRVLDARVAVLPSNQIVSAQWPRSLL